MNAAAAFIVAAPVPAEDAEAIRLEWEATQLAERDRRLRRFARLAESIVLRFWLAGAAVGLATCAIAQAAIALSR